MRSLLFKEFALGVWLPRTIGMEYHHLALREMRCIVIDFGHREQLVFLSILDLPGLNIPVNLMDCPHLRCIYKLD